jgi:hypothetical protein
MECFVVSPMHFCPEGTKKGKIIMSDISFKIPTQPKQIPLTNGLPLLGSLLQLIKNPFGYLKQARETYGDIYKLNQRTATLHVAATQRRCGRETAKMSVGQGRSSLASVF